VRTTQSLQPHYNVKSFCLVFGLCCLF
jgi:hypothetical protein